MMYTRYSLTSFPIILHIIILVNVQVVDYSISLYIILTLLFIDVICCVEYNTNHVYIA